jgi:prepilin-type N-terminal cleavage/methylation domain-containing protein
MSSTLGSMQSRKFKAKRAFTLIEVLIATLLLAIVLTGLYSVLDTQRRSVKVIKKSLDRSVEQDRAIMVLYNDILQSDGNITIKKGERDTICIESTTNSLYELDSAKVCWLVLKNGDSLARVEGNGYKLPLGLEDKVEVDIVTKGVKLFDIYNDKKSGNYLVVMQELNKEPFSFLVQGKIAPPKPKPKKKPIPKKKPAKKKENNNTKQNPNNQDQAMY